ncbi:U3 small nucleolar RNA-interacting protein 2, putative [Plasmodium malariae]|uniref:U3 small nucleolar RNA-interacting protein 2, putative n=2 Tax=Plasmodium malariae TaxID=5858 RepID=A0A1D3TF36_PLAMA|nr:U3 small nucleolar RNA-interacting protein 2, putative [Plasmodium malariae]SCP03550.1 U3 small nucleolar RNA-interacting protein 2, putative [Plasmodium malariae]
MQRLAKMKFNKKKKFFRNVKNTDSNRRKNADNSEVESDEILTSEASEDDKLTLVNKKKKRNNENNEESDDEEFSNKNYSDQEENDDTYNNPEERKMYLAKKYLKDLGIESTDGDDSSNESSTHDGNEEASERSKLSDNFSSDENEDNKEKINKMLMEKEKSKNSKILLNLENKIKIFRDEKLLSNILNNNNKRGHKNLEHMNSSGKNIKMDENVLFFGGHKKSVTCVACPDFNLSFFDHYDYKLDHEKYKYDNKHNGKYDENSVPSGWNRDYFYKNSSSRYESIDDFDDNDHYLHGDRHPDCVHRNSNGYGESILEPKNFENTSINTVYTGGKDACIIEWDLTRGEKVHIYKGDLSSFKDFGNKSGINHFKSVMDICCNKFNSFFISVGCDNLINIWDNRVNKSCTNSVIGHKHIISAVIGCNDNTDELNMEHNFFTSSYDKTIKLWDLRFFNKCINTYLGHTNTILSMNSLNQNKLITSSSDYTVRVWNTKNDNHILFNINYEIIESCCTLNNKIFIAGTFTGHFYIFTSSYKKHICIHKNAHSSYSITALTSIPYTNIFISGSYDGYVHFWQYKNINKTSGSVHKILTVQVNGTINKFSFSHNYKYLFVAVGDEMKHGRWTRTKSKNGLAVIPIQFMS